VVWDDVDQDVQPQLLGRLVEALETLLPSKLRVNLCRIDDVVAVVRALSCLRDGGEVERGYAKLFK